MNTATIMDLAWEGAQVAFRLIMAARTRRDAEAIVHQLRALGPAPRADVGAVEAEALRRLRQDEPTQSTRTPLGELADAETAALPKGERVRLAPDFPRDPDACQECHRMPCVCDMRPLIGGPLDGGD